MRDIKIRIVIKDEKLTYFIQGQTDNSIKEHLELIGALDIIREREIVKKGIFKSKRFVEGDK